MVACVEVATGEVAEAVPQVEATSIPYASPLDRFATVVGLIEEASVSFVSAERVPQAGVLLGLALLPETHLMEEAREVYGRLKNCWYGLRPLLWTLIVMALLRVKRPEQIKSQDPFELGPGLGPATFSGSEDHPPQTAGNRGPAKNGGTPFAFGQISAAI